MARLGAVIAAVAGAAALALLPAGAASAHDYLVSSTPAANSTVTEPVPSVTLTFDDIVLDEGGHGALVQVTDASGRNFETDCASVNGRSVTAPVALGAPGSYRVTWQVVSADGHPVSDSMQFNYQGPKAGGGHDGPLAKCGKAVRAPAAQSKGAQGGGAEQSASVSPTVIVIISVAGGVVVLAIVAVLLVILLGGRKRKAGEE
ncbi:copper resistance CopC family protein [Gryllotalpicola koreensis]|uniref:CopC domain-containing protein n=1 Tax=Gryllotalpicola koreensis TaxID=993086 RepID=A0ABP7ZPK2_9MICO